MSLFPHLTYLNLSTESTISVGTFCLLSTTLPSLLHLKGIQFESEHFYSLGTRVVFPQLLTLQVICHSIDSRTSHNMSKSEVERLCQLPEEHPRAFPSVVVLESRCWDFKPPQEVALIPLCHTVAPSSVYIQSFLASPDMIKRALSRLKPGFLISCKICNTLPWVTVFF
eukprot:TRINITY_DN3492_c0_g1_i2.p1 TRINITY_DN3492_c0_g1~~TRINITY_DN3492_c0_g1_i2.p1  ORF type:complete len:169 (+),score=27.99 TRINITY_DN3492_c0_g1_i2:480-986(+)